MEIFSSEIKTVLSPPINNDSKYFLEQLLQKEKIIIELNEQLHKCKEQLFKLESENSTLGKKNQERIEHSSILNNEEYVVNFIEKNHLQENKNMNKFQSQIKYLQQLLQKESKRKHIVLQIWDKEIKNIESTMVQILSDKIKIHEALYNFNNKNKPVSFVFCQDPSLIYKTEVEYISNLINFLRKYPNYMYKIFIKSKSKIEKECISCLVNNFLYTNIHSFNSNENEILFLLYHTLKYEIKSLDFVHSSQEFLTDSINFYLLKSLSSNYEIKHYFEKIFTNVFNSLEQIDSKGIFQELEFNPIHLNSKIQENKRELKDNTNSNEEIKLLLSGNFSADSMRYPVKCADGYPITEMNIVSFFGKYFSDLTKKELLNEISKKEKNKRMKDYLQKQYDEYTSIGNENLFTNNLFFQKLQLTEESSEIMKIYQSNFSTVIRNINQILINLHQSKPFIPIFFKYICKIISILIKRKFPNIIDVETNAFIAEFFFNIVIKNLLLSDNIDTLIPIQLVTPSVIHNIKILYYIINQLVRGSFFKSPSDFMYTVFNWYFIDIMPKVFEIFDDFTDVELPPFLQNIITEDDNINNNLIENYVFEKEEFNYQMMCLTTEQIYNIMTIIQRNEQFFLGNEINKQIKEDFPSFRASYNILKHSEHLIYLTNAVYFDEQSNPQRKTFVLFKELILSGNIQTAKRRVDDSFNHFNGTRLIANERTQILLKNIKQSISEILINIDIPYPFCSGIDNTISFFNYLLEIIQMNFFILENKQKIKFLILNLISLLPKLPDEYRLNDYFNLYDEIINNICDNIKKIDLNLFFPIIDRSKQIYKEMKKTERKLKDINKAKFNHKLKDFVTNAQLNLVLVLLKTRNTTIVKIYEYELGIKYQYLENFLFEKKVNENKTKNIVNILEFIKYFPNCNKITQKDKIFSFEKEVQLPEAIQTYYKFIWIYLKKKIYKEKNIPQVLDKSNISSSTINSEEGKKLFNEVKNYIMNHLYLKLFPLERSSEDLHIYNKCLLLSSWVELKHFMNYQEINLEIIIPGIKECIQQFELVRIPFEKMIIWSKVSKIIIDVLGYNDNLIEENYRKINQIIIFIIIKSQPKYFASNLEFIELYYEDLENSGDYKLFKSLSAIKDILLNFNHSNLLNVSEEEYNEKCLKNKDKLIKCFDVEK